MLSIAQAREIATKEWEENFPEEHEKLESLKRQGKLDGEEADKIMERAIAFQKKKSEEREKRIADAPFWRRQAEIDKIDWNQIGSGLMSPGIILGIGMSISAMKIADKEQAEKDLWIKFRTEQLVKDSMKGA